METVAQVENFSDFKVWGWMLLFSVLFGSLLIGNIMKRKIPFLKQSLIPTSVISGGILLLVEWVYKLITKEVMFDTAAFGGNGTANLEIITYHTLALGFIASSLKSSGAKLTKKRTAEIFNTGVTTVATYLIQGVVGLAITIIAAAYFMPGFFEAAGVLLPFGYGQGTGQAMNYGGIYEAWPSGGLVGGKSFGLTIAALGFLSAAFGGVFHLAVAKKRGRLTIRKTKGGFLTSERVEGENELPMQENLDKLTVELAFVLVSYAIAYVIMFGIAKLASGMTSVIFGFNFLIGVLSAIIVKSVVKMLRKYKLMNRDYLSNFLLTRISNFFFDVMIVAGVAAIRLDALTDYWGILAILGVAGIIVTYVYNRFVAKKLFPEYHQEQFLMMYGMLTGTASTGTILLREIDPDFETPASDNMVYQNFPAIIFGLPMMFLATFAPDEPVLTLIIFAALFVVLNIILFRGFIFRKRKKTEGEAAEPTE